MKTKDQGIAARAMPYFWAGIALALGVEAFCSGDYGMAVGCLAALILLIRWGDRRLNRWRARAVAAATASVPVREYRPDVGLLLEIDRLNRLMEMVEGERDVMMVQRNAAEQRAAMFYRAKNWWRNELRDLGERVVQSGADWAHMEEPVRTILRDIAAHAACGAVAGLPTRERRRAPLGTGIAIGLAASLPVWAAVIAAAVHFL